MQRKPIGYWVKQLDNLIDTGFDGVLGRDGLTRRGWQVLNALKPGRMTRTGLDDALAPFLTEPGATLQPVLDDLHRRGWVRDLELTAEGATALGELGQRVSAHRDRITTGVSEADYITTVDTLARMCANLRPPDESVSSAA